MQGSLNLAILTAAWIVAVTLTLYFYKKNSLVNGALVPAYLFNLWLIHWVGASIYLLPWYEYHDVSVVEVGFAQSAYGILAFSFGATVLSWILLNRRARSGQSPAPLYNPHTNLPKSYMIAGVVSFILLSFMGQIPTATAMMAMGQQVFVVGLCLACWKAWREGDRIGIVKWLAIALLLPFFTIITRGFIGYGIAGAAIVLTFVTIVIRPSSKVIVALFLVAYLGFSFYVTYMRDRGEIRQVVWGGEPLQARMGRLYETITTLEWFSPWNEEHLRRIDQRLNQNVLVGIAVNRLSEQGSYAYGSTIWEALLALIPRAVWLNKPIFAGSPDIVSQYTGMRFAEGTSVGVGQVMEFYINFGTPGVIVCFLLLGVLVRIIDFMAVQRLQSGDWQGFAVYFLTGTSFLQVGGSLVEVTASAGASVVVVVLINKLVLYGFQRKNRLVADMAVSSPIGVLRGRAPRFEKLRG